MYLSLLCFVALIGPVLGQQLNYHASFTEDIQPFDIDVDDTFIRDTKLKVLLSRLPTAIDSANDSQLLGFAAEVQQYWANELNWTSVQASLNQRFEQYTTIVHLANNSAYSAPVPLHFVHLRSPRSDATPLLFLHGWPGSFLEVEHIMHPLANPPNASLPAFHVVAPSIPGFAFSPAPVAAGFGSIAAAHAFNALMLKLGYARYALQGGDFGSVILRHAASLYPAHVAGALSNFWPVTPSAAERARVAAGRASPDEAAYVRTIDAFLHASFAYALVQQQAPLRLAVGLGDSPLGLAMWMYDLVGTGAGEGEGEAALWAPATVVLWALMYYIPGPYGGFRFYRENMRDGDQGAGGFAPQPYVRVPVGIAEFPRDLWYRLPLAWAQRTGNVQKRYLHERGGHFAAWEVPDELLGDIWDFFSGLDLRRGDRMRSDACVDRPLERQCCGI